MQNYQENFTFIEIIGNKYWDLCELIKNKTYSFIFGVGIEVENPWNIVFLCCPLLLVVCTIGP